VQPAISVTSGVATPSGVDSVRVKAYKRFADPVKPEPVLEAKDSDGRSTLVVGAAAGPFTHFECSWCEQAYERAVSGGNCDFVCANCKNTVWIDRISQSGTVGALT